MAWDNIRIVKAANDENGDEQFYIVQFDASLQPTQPGYTREAKGPLREAVIRDFLRMFGKPVQEIDELFRAARANDAL